MFMPGVKALEGMLLGSYQVEMNFTRRFILVMVWLVVLFKYTLVRAKELSSNFFTIIKRSLTSACPQRPMLYIFLLNIKI